MRLEFEECQFIANLDASRPTFKVENTLEIQNNKWEMAGASGHTLQQAKHTQFYMIRSNGALVLRNTQFQNH